MEAIVYSSACGHTARYARLLSEKTGIPLVEVRKVRRKLYRGDDVIFMGWVMAGIVDKYMDIYNHYNIRIMCPVGIMPFSDWVDQNLRSRNLIPEEVSMFYLRGGFEMSRVRGFRKIMAKSFRVSMEMDFDDNETPESGELFRLMSEGCDFFEESQLDPVIERIGQIQIEDSSREDEER